MIITASHFFILNIFNNLNASIISFSERYGIVILLFGMILANFTKKTGGNHETIHRSCTRHSGCLHNAQTQH